MSRSRILRRASRPSRSACVTWLVSRAPLRFSLGPGSNVQDLACGLLVFTPDDDSHAAAFPQAGLNATGIVGEDHSFDAACLERAFREIRFGTAVERTHDDEIGIGHILQSTQRPAAS